ncbi:MAG TPA: S41 family peptidase [Candidatus Evtepia faecavium]|nr:S41 family peptidase [Candidatus Evtepia faecavium]
MEGKKKRRWKTLLLAVVCFVLGGGVTLTVAWQALGQDGQALLQAYRLVTGKFVGEYDQRTMVESTLENMVTALGDRWSGYLDPQEAQQVKTARANTYVGIGVTVGQEPEDGLEILRVTEGGPAQAAGLAPGEIIRGVDGQTITAENRADLVNAIQGEAGTTVTLEVEGTDGARRTVEVTRQEIHGLTAAWTMLADQVGLVNIQNFYSGTADLVRQGVEELQAQGARALVFDLRNNPGGYVTELTEILDFLLPEGTIFISRTNDGEETVYTSDAACVDLPMAVLVNAESYSAAEFFAAELREAAGAVVAGEQTSGKGYSQMLFTLADGSAISLSTARYYTGSGISLIGTGVTPEPLVALSQEEAQRLLAGTLSPEEDPQLQSALEALG